MQRVTISLDDDLAEEIDRFAAGRGYESRSEALRDLARNGLRQAAEDSDVKGSCVAALVYVYEHDLRDLPKRLAHTFHDHHELSVSAMHVHLDHETCLELNILRGDAKSVRKLGETVIAERGVRYGRLVVMPADIEVEKHKHAHHQGSSRHHSHTHVRRAG